MLTADEIMLIDKPENIFIGSKDNVKKIYHRLAMQFHPDKNPNNGDAFKKLNELYKTVLNRIKDETWGLDGSYRIKLKDGYHDIHSLTSRNFELGHMYIDDDHVTFIVEMKYKNLCSNVKNLSFKFASDRMERQINKYLPVVKSVKEMENGNMCVVFDKHRDLLSLRDVLTYYNGRIPGKHVTWIIGTLNNLICYFNYLNISHQDINLDTYFINPSNHTGCLIGGWWYMKKIGETVINVPTRTLNVLPYGVKRDKKASHLTDQELIKSLGREMLGGDLKMPPAIAKWLTSIASDNAIDNYANWIFARNSSGKREFVKMKITQADLYG